MQRAQKVNVWAGTIGNQIVKPVFFNDYFNGTMYLTFLQEYLVSGLVALFPNALDPDLPYERICINRTELHPIMP
jgi:hypothetical protein